MSFLWFIAFITIPVGWLAMQMGFETIGTYAFAIGIGAILLSFIIGGTKD